MVPSLSRQCRLLDLSRSSLYYRPKGESEETLALMRRIDELFLKYPFYGSRQIVRRYGKPEIFNTDQGSQFTSAAFVGVLEDAKVRISMDGRGRFLDNIFIERLWRSLKYEAVYLHELTSGLEARGIIGWPGNRELSPKQSPRSRRAGERQGASRYDRTGVAEPASGCRWLNASSIHPGRWSPRTTTAFRFDRDR